MKKPNVTAMEAVQHTEMMDKKNVGWLVGWLVVLKNLLYAT